MPARSFPNSHFDSTAVLAARNLTHARSGRTVLRDVSLTIGPRSCLGVIGPNGVGKSTLLQILGGLLAPDAGVVSLDPPAATVGYLAQEHERRDDETVLELLARRTGVAQAEAELVSSAAGLSLASPEAASRYDVALGRFEALGASSFSARAETVLGELSVAQVTYWPTTALSGGQAAKVALASVELSRFDVVLLDEPTNDLDFDGLERLLQWVRQRRGATVIVSHDRDFLERTVTGVLEIDEHHHSAVEFGGGWSGYLAERANALRLAREAFEEYERQRGQLAQRANRQRQWATEGVKKEMKDPPDHDKAQRDFRLNRTEKLAHKARQTERAIERLDVVEKPFEGWDLRFRIDETARAGDVVVRLRDVTVARPNFRLGPIDLEVAWGDRLAVTGANGSGKTTLIDVALGSLPVTSGERWMGPGVVVGVLGQDRRSLQGEHNLVRFVGDRCGLTQSETRSLLAKFGLSAAHVTRPASELSPGERTRAELAVFQSLGVNFLVLDEPTNHLDLPAIEQLERALANFGGTMLLTTHDRRFLSAVDVSRTLELRDGVVSAQS
jgi:ATPase subunit of ABC transporter with duplicated ATPase domains